MSSSLRSHLDEAASSLLRGSGKFAMRVGNKLQRMGVNASPWQHATDTSVGRPIKTPTKSPVDRAQRNGYVKHGEFKLKIAYDPDVLPADLVARIERGGYERFEGRRSRDLVVDGDRIVELGAGLGFLSALIMSTKQVEDYQAIEADPRLAEVIKRTHELNGVDGPVTIRTCVATCDEEMINRGEVEFHVGEKFCASSLLGARNPKATVTVPVVSLPELIRGQRSNVLIADIEGAETGVFNGTPLDGIERILLEIHPHRIRDDGVRKIFRDLDRLGYVYDTRASAGAVLGFHRIP